MKLIDILKEIGDSSAKPYPYYRIGRNLEFDTLTYEFDAEAGEYQVDIEKIDLDDGTLKYVVGFGLKSDDRVSSIGTSIDYTQETNKGELFNVMATVVEIVKKEMSLDRDNEYYVTKLAFSPTKAREGDTRREKLYLAYIKNYFPNSTVNVNNNEVEVTLNKPKK